MCTVFICTIGIIFTVIGGLIVSYRQISIGLVCVQHFEFPDKATSERAKRKQRQTKIERKSKQN